MFLRAIWRSESMGVFFVFSIFSMEFILEDMPKLFKKHRRRKKVSA